MREPFEFIPDQSAEERKRKELLDGLSPLQLALSTDPLAGRVASEKSLANAFDDNAYEAVVFAAAEEIQTMARSNAPHADIVSAVMQLRDLVTSKEMADAQSRQNEQSSV